MMLEKKTKEIIFVNKTKKTQLLQQHLKIIIDKQDVVKKLMMPLIYCTMMVCGHLRREWTWKWGK